MTHRMTSTSLKFLAAFSLLSLAACSPPAPVSSAKAPATAATVQAPAPSMSNLEKANALIQGASHGSAHVDHVFEGPDQMIGAVVINPNQTKDIIFISPGGQVLFPGGGFTVAGKNIAEEALVSQHVYISPDELTTKSAEVGFVVGSAGPVITAFMDPNCYWCHVFYTKVMPLVDAGKVRVRYVMVAAIKPSSLGRATAILASKDPAAALKKDELGFNVKQEEGGMAPLKETDAKVEQQVRDNTALMGSAGKISTPGLLYCAAATSKTVYSLGMPPDIDAFVAGASTQGHPACAK